MQESMTKPFDIIVTLNPGTMTAEELKLVVEHGATLIRINGSFLFSSGVEQTVEMVREVCGDRVELLLDLPGFKPRFTGLTEEIRYEPGKPMTMPLSSFNHPEIAGHMVAGDVIRINDGMVRLTVADLDRQQITFVPDLPGVLRRGKGFYMEKKGYRPQPCCLTELDEQLIAMARQSGIDYVGISFVHDMADVEHVRRLLGNSATGFIPKIESRASLELANLLPLVSGCDRVIIDRGDLSGEMGLEAVWRQQRRVLDLARMQGCRVIMATQFLTSMMNRPLPTIAEVDSLIDLLHFGIDGVQLSEETCVGRHGADVVRLVTESRLRVEAERAAASPAGKVVWIMGPTSSGKTTLAAGLVERLGRSKISTIHYDGDEFRDLFGPDFAFGPENRLLVVQALVHHAAKAAALGHNVVVSALTANEEARAFVCGNLDNLTVVYLKCPIEVCAGRDPKGLYAKAANGEIDTLPGISTPYRPPQRQDIVIDTADKTPDACLEELVTKLLAERRIRFWGEECG